MTQIHWKQPVSGDFGVGADWAGGAVPAKADDAIIDPAGTYTVAINAAEAAHSLTVDDSGATVADNATLTLGSSLTLTSGTFQLNAGGTIVGGALSASGGTFAWNGGVLSGVTYDGTLDLSAAYVTLAVSGGLRVTGANGTGLGTINLTGVGSQLSVNNSETLDNATLNIGAGSFPIDGANLALSNPSGSSTVVTFGSQFHIVQTGLFAFITDTNFNADSIVNNGAITAGFSKGLLQLPGQYFDNFTNNGSIIVSNGDSLNLSSMNFINRAGGSVSVTGSDTTAFFEDYLGSFTNTAGATISVTGSGASATLGGGASAWSNAGTITIGADATVYIDTDAYGPGSFSNTGTITLNLGAKLYLGHDFTTATLASITNNGGEIFIDGTLTNAGATLDVGPGTAQPILGLVYGGSIVGGTVVDKGSGLQVHDGDLNGVTYDGAIDLSAAGATLFVDGGLTGAGVNGVGSGTINLTGTGSELIASGPETLNDETLNMGSSGNGGSELLFAQVLTLGARFTIVQSGLQAGIFDDIPVVGDAIVNDGAITAGVSGGSFQINVPDFTNDGSVSISNGDTLFLKANKFRNDGQFTAAGNGYVTIVNATIVNEAAGVIDANAGVIVLDTPGNTLTNTGLLEASGAGSLVIVGTTVDDSGGGTLQATGATVYLQGVEVIGGTLSTSGSGAIVVKTANSVLDGTSGHAVTLAGALVIEDKSALTIQASIVNKGQISIAGAADITNLIVGAGGATLSGGGQVVLSDSTANRIDTAGAGQVTLTNIDNRIFGAGDISNATLTLINEVAGVIVATDSIGLIISTGANAVDNVGLIEATGAGGLTIKSAVDNTGVLYAAKGNLTVDGAVSGAGIAKVAGATLDFASAFSENVTFVGGTGVLELARSQSYGGRVAGFSKTGGTTFDLRDIGFIAGKTQATYSGTTASGTLTVTEGAHTAHIRLAGDYLGSTFRRHQRRAWRNQSRGSA